jgi:hypothetical protein
MIVAQTVEKQPDGSLPCSQEPGTEPYLRQLNLVNTFKLSSCEIHFNIRLPRTSSSSKLSL